ncbi:MAG: proton-conducting transporter membrane subunit [Candidatus Thermoplasmatota archaeon]|nr:proton-conducting transporter membrane subunit [Candidatus Thermoplasmatota archaeon]
MNFLDQLLSHAPALLVAIPLLGAFLTPLIGRVNDKLRNIFVIGILGFTGILVILLAQQIFASGPITYVFGSLDPYVGKETVIRILFEIDALSIFMAMIAIVLSFSAALYSWAYMEKNTGLDKYYSLLLLLTVGMLGMVLTGDMFNFFVFLEITSIASCALIAFYINKVKSVEAGFKYIVVSTIGALFVLMAIALLYGQYDALNIAKLADSITFSFVDKIALVLLIAALAMKGGIVPMHMWLPDAYSRAPASVSLILIGTTQAGLYGVFRVLFTLYGNVITLPTISMGWALVILGLLTMLVGVIMALIQIDFKRLIAYGAIAELGYMFLGVGTCLTILANPDITLAQAPFAFEALKGGLFHVFNDALDVGLLFMVAGAVYYATKETSLNRLGGLARNMKYTTIFFIIGLLAISGIPPMNGFASKLLIYESTYQLNPILSIIAILSSIMLLAIFIKVFHAAFLGPKLPQFDTVKEVPRSMLLAMGFIAAFIIIFGLFPDLIVNTIVDPAANALIDNAGYMRWLIGG